MKPPTPDLTRLSVNMNRETTNLLRSFANERSLTYTEAIRRCIAVMKFIQDEVDCGRNVYTAAPGLKDARELVLL